MDKKILVVGMGNGGSQVSNLCEKKYSSIMDCVYINTSAADLEMVSGSMKFKIGETDEVEGSGMNRLRMKNYLRGELPKILQDENFLNMCRGKRYIFVIATAAGGTGSGGAPAFMSVLKGCFPDTNLVLVGILPHIQTSLMAHGNSIEFLEELYETMDDDTTYMIYDNETMSHLSPTNCLEEVNNAIVEDIKIISGIDNFPTPYDSIDEADMETIVSTPGRLHITRVTKDLTEKTLEDISIDDIIIKTIKKSCHAETDRNKKVERWGIITHFTNEVNDLYVSKFEKLTDFIGTPKERFNHHSINPHSEDKNFLYLIASGLSPINDRVKKIKTRINELKDALAKDEASKYILSSDNEDSSSYSASAMRKKEKLLESQDDEIEVMDIFNKFMK